MGETQFRTNPSDPLALIRERDLAMRWSISTRTLQRWRAEGYGPAWINVGGAVRYRPADIAAFEDHMRCEGRIAR